MNAFKLLHERFVTRDIILHHLTLLLRECNRGIWNETDPEENTDSSKDCLYGREGLRKWMFQVRYIIERLSRNTYQPDTFLEGFRDAEENIDDRCQTCHQLVIALEKWVESPCLLSKYIQDGIWRNIIFKCRSEWVRF